MEFGLSALREQVPPIPKTRPSVPPRPDVFDTSVNSDINTAASNAPKTTGYTPPAKASNTYLNGGPKRVYQ